ncbi:hypothetical protein TCAL_01190 [Tigriopus californicus]|uniref:Major facilitator superfamily (MFS) profile domain-containing protein n=1 Tax=Tigriopus californicus TaxID=6832 RepID=A0A553NXF6_TIGCA|nr:hypothetical protein TCAL_01190 [Tigriopus californicus]
MARLNIESVEPANEETDLNPKNPGSTIKIGDILDTFGAWQIKRVALMFFLSLPGCAHIFAMIFATVKEDFWCEANGQSNETINQCEEGCPKYVFDRSIFQNTVTMRYGLVCEKHYWEPLSKLSLFGGYAIGTFLAGVVSDNFGRKQAITIFSQLLFCSGIIITLMPNIMTFSIMWFIVGMSSISVYTVAFVWVSEIVGGSWKVIVCLVLSMSFPIARLIVTLTAYFIRDYEILFQVFSSLHLFTPMLMLFVPESPRWLLSLKRPEKRAEACHTLSEIAKSKGIPFEMDFFEDGNVNKGAAFAGEDHFSLIFTHKLLRMRAFTMLYCWFTTSFVVYSVSLNMRTLTGSLFINLILTSILDIPAKTLGFLIMRKYSIRRSAVIGTFFMGAALAGVCGLLDNSVPWQKWLLSGLLLLATMSLSTNFSILWLYTAELYPTGIRNFGVGLSSFIARIGGSGSTAIVYLASIHSSVPFLTFSGMCLAAGSVLFLLPDTGDKPLPNSMREIEQRELDARDKKHESRCIKEKGLVFQHLSLADTQNFKQYSFQECLWFCLQDDNADKTHMLIGYSSGIFSNKFNCLCAKQQALNSAVQVNPGYCDVMCPQSKFKCGNANDDFLSVYCMYKSCQDDSQEPICKKRMPHDFHGCLDGSNIQWKYAHNVRNFTAHSNHHSACIWECHDNHPFAIYSLTRKVNGILTCSCGYPEAFDPGRMIAPELCTNSLPEVDLYFVNCVEDLKPEGGEVETIDYQSQCKEILPIGCLYQELVKTDKYRGVTMKLPDSQKIHPYLCHKLCLSIAQSFLHVGIRFNPTSNLLECSCLQKGAFNDSSVGPRSACNHDCGLKATGFTCGGPSQNNEDLPPAISVYCLHSSYQEPEIEAPTSCGADGWNQSVPLMSRIKDAVIEQIKLYDTIIGLMVFVTLLLLSFVFYLCILKGFCKVTS